MSCYVKKPKGRKVERRRFLADMSSAQLKAALRTHAKDAQEAQEVRREIARRVLKVPVPA